MHDRLWLHCLIILAFITCSGTTWSQEQTPTGFYYPSGISDFGSYAWWLALGCNGSTNYLRDSYHLGQDMRADVGDAVYAISEGTVISRSTNGWGDGNIAKPFQN